MYFLTKTTFFILYNMLQVEKNANSTLILTLAEKATLETPYYLFVFENDVTRNTVTFTAQDLTEFNERYNKFLVTETSGTVNYTSGVIELSPTGFWSYKVYEQEDNTNLDINNTVGLVEQGKLKVTGLPTTNTTYSNKRTFKPYGKGT